MSILNGPMDPVQALAGSMRDFRELQGPDLIGRVGAFYEWQDLRRTHGLWPYSKSTERAPLAVCSARDDSGLRFSGLNFATQDYLGLASDPELKEVAKSVIDEYGVHSAGSSALAGNTKYSLLLERTISDSSISNTLSFIPPVGPPVMALLEDWLGPAITSSWMVWRTHASKKARTRRPTTSICMVTSI